MFNVSVNLKSEVMGSGELLNVVSKAVREHMIENHKSQAGYIRTDLMAFPGEPLFSVTFDGQEAS